MNWCNRPLSGNAEYAWTVQYSRVITQTERRQNTTHRTRTYVHAHNMVQKLHLFASLNVWKRHWTQNQEQYQTKNSVFVGKGSQTTHKNEVASSPEGVWQVQGKIRSGTGGPTATWRASECSNWTSAHLHHTADHYTTLRWGNLNSAA